MQQTFKTKVTNLLQEKLEAQDAFDDSSNMNESEYSEELFIFYPKQATTLAEKVLESFLKVSSITSLKYN